jgi:hypothetical protein
MGIDAPRILLKGFSGGMVGSAHAPSLAPGVFQRLENVNTYRKIGSISSREGVEIVAPLTAAAGVYTPGDETQPVKGLYVWRGMVGGTYEKHFIVVTKAHIRITRASDGVMLKDQVIAAANPTRFIDFAESTDKNRVYITYGETSGFQGIAWWDGATLKQAGFPAPTAVATAATAGGGVLTGTYKYVYTYVYGDLAEESSRSPLMAGSVSTSSNQVNVTIAVGPVTNYANVTQRILYRSLRDDFSRYYFHGIIADNVTTVVLDNIADAALGPELSPDDAGLPPNQATTIEVHKGRMFAAVDNVLRFSAAVGNETAGVIAGIHGAGPEIFPSTFQITVGHNSDPILKLAVLHERLIVFKRYSIWQLLGSGPEDFILDQVDPRVGCIAPNSVAVLPDRIFFVGYDEQPRVYQFDGARATPISIVVDDFLADEVDSRDIFQKNNTSGEKVPAVAFANGRIHDNTYLLSLPRFDNLAPVPAGSGAPRLWTMLAYHYSEGAWFIYKDILSSCMANDQGKWGGGVLFIGSANGGGFCFVMRYGEIETDEREAAWTDTGGGNYAKGANTVFQILTLIKTGCIKIGENTLFRDLKWIHVTTQRYALGTASTPVQVTVRSRWDEQEDTLAAAPPVRTYIYSTNVTNGSSDASRTIVTHRISASGPSTAGTGGSVAQLNADIGQMLQLIVESDRAYALHEIGISIHERELR